MGNPIVVIRQSYDHLISTMGFPTLLRCHLYTEFQHVKSLICWASWPAQPFAMSSANLNLMANCQCHWTIVVKQLAKINVLWMAGW